jgi:hypothetical protein
MVPSSGSKVDDDGFLTEQAGDDRAGRGGNQNRCAHDGVGRICDIDQRESDGLHNLTGRAMKIEGQ